MQIVFFILLFILGACFGSFLCCQARRLHLKTQKNPKKLNKRSVCLSCGYQLKWYDNIPIFSWLTLKGKCRKCGKKIGVAELLSELGLGLAFLLLGISAYYNGLSFSSPSIIAWCLFVFTLIFTLILSFLAIYDGLYGELPTLGLIIAILGAIVIVVLRELGTTTIFPDLIDLLFAVLILGGIYFVLYLVSKGKWVGDGDWLLGTAIALALGTPWFAIIALFISNLLACIIMFPIVKKTHHTKIYFGPFMVVAFVLVQSFATFFLYALGD